MEFNGIINNATTNTEETQKNNASVQLTPLTSGALKHFSPEAQEKIKAVAGQIDVRQIEKVMAYGQAPLVRSFERSGMLLKDVQGSSEDQEVVKEVTELAKQANQNYEDFNIVIKEPNFLQKLILKISSSAKEKHDGEVSLRAITNFKLLEQLSESCDKWLEMLKDGFTKIHLSITDDMQNAEELEQYIVAGRIAEERIEEEVAAAKAKWELTGFLADKEEYDKLKEGLDTFRIVLLNLEKSRAAFGISLGQLDLQEKTNKNVQIAVRTQRANSMALAAQQLRNAVLNAKNKLALEGQKSISSLNNELMKKISENTVLTAEESEKVLLNGVYSIEAALEAAKTVMVGCEQIKKAREDRKNNISQELGKLKSLLGELEPFVTRIQENSDPNSSSTSSSSVTSSGTGGLKF